MKIVQWCRADGIFWIRVFGSGFYIRDTARHKLRYSERGGYTTFWMVKRLRRPS